MVPERENSRLEKPGRADSRPGRDGASPIVGYSAAQVAAAERPYLRAGIPLMQRAAAGLAEVTAGLLPSVRGSVLVLAGPGNNGGDGLFAAQRLAQAGHVVYVLPVMGSLHVTGRAAAQEAGVNFLTSGSEDVIVASIAGLAPDVVVDAILGTGSVGRAELRGTARAVVAELLRQRDSGKEFSVVAADLPSGLDPDSGQAAGPVLPATVTATFGAPKAGLLQGDGPALSGTLWTIPIGIEEDLARMEPALRIG